MTVPWLDDDECEEDDASWLETWRQFLGDDIFEEDVSGRNATAIAITHGLTEQDGWYIYGWYMWRNDQFDADYEERMRMKIESSGSEEQILKLAGWLDAKGI